MRSCRLRRLAGIRPTQSELKRLRKQFFGSDSGMASVLTLLATHATTPGEGLGLISSDSTFVSRMIIRQIPAPGAWRRVAATQIRVRQTLQIVGEWSPLGFPLPVRKRLELSAKSPWPPPPSNVRDVRGLILRRFICSESSRGYGQMFVRALAKDNGKTIETLQTYLLERGWPDDHQFESAFATFPLYQRGYTRQVLETLE